MGYTSSIAGQLNQLPVDMQGNVLGVGMPGGSGIPPYAQIGFGMPGGDAAATTDQQAQQMQMGGMPGLGGKGGMITPQSMGQQIADQQGATPGMPMPGMGTPGMGGKGPIAQIPIDMSGQVLGAGQTAQPGQPPGLPTPQAPMVPQGGIQPVLGVGSGGMPPGQQPMNDPYGYGKALGLPQPGGMQNRLAPKPVAPAAYGRNAVVNPRARVTAQPVQSMKRGAGRGGLLR